jgi:hypothetical protein
MSNLYTVFWKYKFSTTTHKDRLIKHLFYEIDDELSACKQIKLPIEEWLMDTVGLNKRKACQKCRKSRRGE